MREQVLANFRALSRLEVALASRWRLPAKRARDHHLRLASSTAVHAVPDTLLADKAFAVGNEAFQKKCVDKMNQFKAEGKTIVIVSHALNTVKALCQRSLLLSKGRVATIGNIEKVMNDYLAILQGGITRASFARMT